ncbi:MAG: hypothetical protein GY847_39995 [Proteobacteria bacterium]|nr:hypothetical protein [Pseudomonadota bacterium]
MSPSTKKSAPLHNPDALLDLMELWPKSWAGTSDDIPIGKKLVAEMKPFIIQLHTLGLSKKTIRRHLDNLWVIGGEIIREINYEPALAKKQPRKLLFDTVSDGEAPYVHNASESEHRSFDSTARRLFRFLVNAYMF